MDIDVEQYSDINQLKCGQVFVSSGSLNFSFTCVFCEGETTFSEFNDFGWHIKNVHFSYIDKIRTGLDSKQPREEESPCSSDWLYDEQEVPAACEIIATDDGQHEYESMEVLMDDEEDCLNVDESDNIDENFCVYKEFITEFIDMYHKCLVLWHKKTAKSTPSHVIDSVLKLLFKSYAEYYPDRTLNDMKNRFNDMKHCVDIDFKHRINRKMKEELQIWFSIHLMFLGSANEEEIEDEDFENFNCPWCEECNSTCSVELWSHISSNHLTIEPMDTAVAKQTNDTTFSLQSREADILQFIDLFREQESLWNTNSMAYNDNSIKSKAYGEIIEKFNNIAPNKLTNSESVKKAIQNLRDYFVRTDKKAEDLNPHNTTASPIIASRNKIYEKLMFLRDVYTPEKVLPYTEHQCEMCQTKFLEDELLLEHIIEQHSDADYYCEQCPKIHLRSQSHVDIHRSEHVTANEKTYPCAICQEIFENSDKLAMHLNDHLPSSSKAHTCQICKAKFHDRSNLSIHIRRHTYLKNYLCKVCGKDFVTSSQLKSHAIVHSDERPYICEICGVSYKYGNRLNAHRLLHGEQKHECVICHKTFPTKLHLYQHQRTHAPEEVILVKIPCDICKGYFRNHDSLSRHLRKFHNIRKPRSLGSAICNRSMAYNDN